MWIDKLVMIIRDGIAAAVLLLLIGCLHQPVTGASAVEPLTAWWVDMAFTPADNSVDGFDVQTLNPAWEHATALDERLLEERLSERDLKAFQASDLSFALTADIDEDGVSEAFFVGVYQSRTGGMGRFVAIARDGQLVKVFHRPGRNGFSALLQKDRQIRWYQCMECGDFDPIEWDGKKFVLVF